MTGPWSVLSVEQTLLPTDSTVWPFVHRHLYITIHLTLFILGGQRSCMCVLKEKRPTTVFGLLFTNIQFAAVGAMTAFCMVWFMIVEAWYNHIIHVLFPIQNIYHPRLSKYS